MPKDFDAKLAEIAKLYKRFSTQDDIVDGLQSTSSFPSSLAKDVVTLLLTDLNPK